MSIQTKALLERYLQAWNEGLMDAVKETCSPDFVFHQPPLPDTIGVDDHLTYIAAFKAAMPDVRIVIDQLLVDGEYYAARYTLSGTHTGA